MNADTLGYLGSMFLCMLYIPLVYRVYTIQDANSISWLSLVLQYCTGTCFILYGIEIRSYPVVVANSSCIVCAILLTGGKYLYGRSSTRVATDIV